MEYSSWAGGGGVVINTVCPVCAFATKWAHEDSIVHFCAGDPIEWGGSIDDEEDEEDDDNKSDRLTEWDLFRYFVSCMVANVRPSLDRCREIREQCPNLPPYTKIPDNYLTTEFWQTKRGTSVKTGWVPPSEWRIPTLSSELS